MDAVLDRRLSKVNGTHVEPRVPGANFIGVVEDVAKAVVNDVAESDVDVLGPKFTKPWSESFVEANK